MYRKGAGGNRRQYPKAPNYAPQPNQNFQENQQPQWNNLDWSASNQQYNTAQTYPQNNFSMPNNQYGNAAQSVPTVQSNTWFKPSAGNEPDPWNWGDKDNSNKPTSNAQEQENDMNWNQGNEWDWQVPDPTNEGTKNMNMQLQSNYVDQSNVVNQVPNSHSAMSHVPEKATHQNISSKQQDQNNMWSNPSAEIESDPWGWGDEDNSNKPTSTAQEQNNDKNWNQGSEWDWQVPEPINEISRSTHAQPESNYGHNNATLQSTVQQVHENSSNYQNIPTEKQIPQQVNQPPYSTVQNTYYPNPEQTIPNLQYQSQPLFVSSNDYYQDQYSNNLPQSEMQNPHNSVISNETSHQALAPVNSEPSSTVSHNAAQNIEQIPSQKSVDLPALSNAYDVVDHAPNHHESDIKVTQMSYHQDKVHSDYSSVENAPISMMPNQLVRNKTPSELDGPPARNSPVLLNQAPVQDLVEQPSKSFENVQPTVIPATNVSSLNRQLEDFNENDIEINNLASTDASDNKDVAKEIENQEVVMNGDILIVQTQNIPPQTGPQENFYEQKEKQNLPAPLDEKGYERCPELSKPELDSSFTPMYRSTPDIAHPGFNFGDVAGKEIMNEPSKSTNRQEMVHETKALNQDTSAARPDSDCSEVEKMASVQRQVTNNSEGVTEAQQPLPTKNIENKEMNERSNVPQFATNSTEISPSSHSAVVDDSIPAPVMKTNHEPSHESQKEIIDEKIESTCDEVEKPFYPDQSGPEVEDEDRKRKELEENQYYDDRRSRYEDHGNRDKKQWSEKGGDDYYSDKHSDRYKYDGRENHYDDERRSDKDGRSYDTRYDRKDQHDNKKYDKDMRHDDERYDKDDRHSRDQARYGDDEDSFDRNSYQYHDRRRPDSRSRYEDLNYRESSRSRYDGRYSRDHSPEYGRRSRDQSRTRYDDYYGRDQNRNNYYERRHDTQARDDRPQSRQKYDDRYRSYEYDDDRRSRDYRHGESYYRDRSGYGDQYDRMTRERDYLYRKYYYDSYRMGGMGAYNYGYFDELYNSDPRYKEQIEKYKEYYSKRQGYTAADYDRSSIQSSGRNSVTNGMQRNDSFAQDYQQNQSESVLPYNMSSINPDPTQNYSAYQEAYIEEKLPSQEEPIAQEPLFYTSPHVVATFSNSGELIKVLPNDPKSGAPPLVEIQETKDYFDDSSMKTFPGPLIVGETHKHDVIQFCKSKLRSLQNDKSVIDKDSACLIWEYLILIIRQNGSVAGTDIADLLLQNRLTNDSSTSNENKLGISPDEGIFEGSQKNTPDEHEPINNLPASYDKLVNKFREYLLFGHKKDALDWAVKNGLWGHALFLASKMDKRTHGMIMTKFANSLQINDPLQTLYQLMSGRQPSSVTCVADEKWGDWRHHLAMILSNATNKPNIDRKSITTLGDTLATRGCLHAAHFCYLMANSNLGSYSSKSSKLVLIGSSHQNEFKQFATSEAIQCTEIYEYAMKLAQSSFFLPELQYFKFFYATKLFECGLHEESLHYCEVIANEVSKTPAVFSPDLISQLHQFSSKLKFHDPHYSHNESDVYDSSDPHWLSNLKSVDQAYKAGTIQFIVEKDVAGSMSSLPTNDYEASENQNEVLNQQYQSIPQNNLYKGSYSDYNQGNAVEQLNQEPYNQAEGTQQEIDDNLNINQQQPAPNNINVGQNDYGNQALYGGYSEYDQQWNQHNDYMSYNDQAINQNVPDENNVIQPEPENAGSVPSYDYYAAASLPQKSEIERRMSNSSNSSFNRTRRDSHISSGGEKKIDTLAPPKKETEKSKQETAKGGGILSGLFQRLSFRPKNQMYLPDDKNPSIVWDDSMKKWVNKDGDDDQSVAGPAAPPSDRDLSAGNSTVNAPQISNTQQVPAAVPMSNPSNGPPGMQNKFQRPKNKSMRANYVDVFANKSQPSSQNSQTIPTIQPENQASYPAAPSFFVPPPVTGTDNVDFISQNSVMDSNVDHNNKVDEPIETNQPGMPMYNVSDFNSHQPKVNVNQPRLMRPGPRAYPR